MSTPSMPTFLDILKDAYEQRKMERENAELKAENAALREWIEILSKSNTKQTDEYICVDREHGLWKKRKEPKDPNVNADRLALALSLETIQELERENAALKIERNRYRVALQDIADASGAWAGGRARVALRKEAQP